MLSSAVKQGPLILTFVPPNIIPERGESVKVLDPESENGNKNKQQYSMKIRKLDQIGVNASGPSEAYLWFH